MGPHLARYRVEWTGFTGGPGYTNFYFGTSGDFLTPENISEPVAKIDAFLNMLNQRLPSIVSTKLSHTIETIRISDGALVKFDTVASFSRAAGTGTGNWSAASGGCVNWYTSGVRNKRRVRGRTFLVPLAGSALGANGTLDDATVGSMQDAATALYAPTASGARLHIWGRPTPILDANGKPTGNYNADGVAYPVESARFPDKVAVLRSRRD